MKKYNLMDRVLFALSVPQCVGCKTRLVYGQLAFCHKCSTEFDEFKTRNCSRCSKKLNECNCSNEFLRSHYIPKVIKCYRYLDREDARAGNRLIYSLKRDNRSDVLEKASDELVKAILNSLNNPEECIITNVPRRRSAIIEYGIDHSALLAKAVAKKLSCEYRELLRSRAKSEQKTLEITDRFKNADFYILRDIDLTGKRVIIVDDVITTGASVGKAASLIRSLGAKEITAACLAIAYKDS